MISQRRNTMTEEEISVLALEIMKDLRRVSTKTNIDPNDSYIDDFSTKDKHQTKYNIVPLKENDSLHGIPSIPTLKTNNYHHFCNTKRGTKATKLKLKLNSYTNTYTNTNDTNSAIQSISPKSSTPSRLTPSITGYSPYSSKFSTPSTSLNSISISPKYSPQKYIPPLAPMHITASVDSVPSVDISPCLSPRRKKKMDPILANECNIKEKKCGYKRKKKKKKKKMVKFKRDRKTKSDQLRQIGCLKSLVYKSDALKQITIVRSQTNTALKQSLPVFVERDSIQKNAEYGKSAPIPFGVHDVTDASEIESDCTYSRSNSTMYKANIRFLYNSESNKQKSKKKKKKKSRKLREQRKSATPVPQSRTDRKYKMKSKSVHNVETRNNIQCNNEYMIEFEDGFLFVNHNNQ